MDLTSGAEINYGVWYDIAYTKWNTLKLTKYKKVLLTF
jgi:hypothetical protein